MKFRFFLFLLLPFTAIAQDCISLIKPYEHWKETPETEWKLQLTTTISALYYYGAQHETDTTLPQFREIADAWEQFKPTIAFYEGPDRGIKPTAAETIANYGESGYVRFLAQQDDIRTISLEPPIDSLYAYLISKHTQAEVDIYMFTKEAMRLRTRKNANQQQLTTDIGKMMAMVPQMVNHTVSISSVPQLDSMVKARFGKKAQWWNMPGNWFSPTDDIKQTKSFTNSLARLSSEYRNIYMVGLLGRYIQTGYRAFAVIGRNHIPMQADALRCIASKTQW